MESERNNPTLRALTNLRGPLYLPLNRRWAAGAPDSPQRTRSLAFAGQIPIADVLRLAERAYRQEQTDVARRNESLRHQIIASLFEKEEGTSFTSPPSVREVRANAETVVAGLEQLGVPSARAFTDPYFASLERFARRLADKTFDASVGPEHEDWDTWIEWATTASQHQHRVQRLLDLIAQYQDETDLIKAKTTSFIELMSSFLKDSHKGLAFDGRGELVVVPEAGEPFNVADLSSGELQLLTLFTFLYFQFDVPEEFTIIIDEPELSLHLEWQRRYLDSITEANPNAQFILATHSPEIAGTYRDRFIDLSP